MTTLRPIRIGTRKSKLAMWQTEAVAAMLQDKGMTCELSGMETKGDKLLGTSIAKIGSKGVFTEELELQLYSGQTDIAVHSAKDLQSVLPAGFELIAFSAREQVNDVLIADRKELDPEDSAKSFRIGTSSVRRIAFLKHYYPHLEIVEMRGNLQTRIAKMRAGACDALMLAYAGVKRMRYLDMIIHTFPENTFVPPVGQGCIAVEASVGLAADIRKKIREAVNDLHTEWCLLAERAFLQTLEGGCSIPAFALATLETLENARLSVHGGLVSLDGATVLSRTVSGPCEDACDLGRQLADEVLAAGGRQMLQQIRSQLSVRE